MGIVIINNKKDLEEYGDPKVLIINPFFILLLISYFTIYKLSCTKNNS
ncbi:hypothetical protein CPAV1605_838 [seawater metagenome]|uniref:Uncharacterized protein n=1 Tax=seawater metagenome TaxID=1561972 RepID=A0A5E8CI96_9ZZZZ